MTFKENLAKTRETLREEIVNFPLALEDHHSRWWVNFTQIYRRLRRKAQESEPELGEYLDIQLNRVKGVLKKNLPEMKGGILAQTGAEIIAATTDSLILQVSREMASDFSPRVEGMNENILSVEEMLKRKPEQIQSSEISVNNVDFLRMGVRKNSKDDWRYFLLPKLQTIGLKGGPPRALLDIIADSPQSMIDAELPWNDIDVIATGDENTARGISEIMGVDPEGLEVFSHKASDIDFTLYCLGRDTTQNQAYLNANGLHFSDAAWVSAQTGETQVVGQYIKGRAIYGVDVLNFGGTELVKPRGMMRLVKAVAEGKALSFEYKPASSVMDFGIYWLVLARKWSDRPTFGDDMQKLFYLCTQMRQVRPEEKNLYAVLTRAHATYPFFDFFSPAMDMVDVARWKAGKLIKQADREFAWRYQIPSGIKIPKEVQALPPVKISLKGFSPSRSKAEAFTVSWPDFLSESRLRTASFYRENKDLVQRFFLKSDLEESILDQYVDFED